MKTSSAILGMALCAKVLLAEPTTFLLADREATQAVLRIRAVGADWIEHPMSRVWRDLFETRVDLNSGEYEYVFEINGTIRVTDINQYETRRDESGSLLSVLRVYSSGAPPASNSRYPIVLELDAPDARRVAFAGSFNEWRVTPMRPIGRGRWRGTSEAPAGSHGYKFIVDQDWILDPAHSEVVLIDGVENSRLDVPQRTAGLPNPPPANSHLRTVPFSFYAPAASRVALAGTMNDWNADTHELIRGENGFWQLDVDLRPGRYEYKFVADGNWLTDPNNPNTTPPEQGRNSILDVRADAPSLTTNIPLLPAATGTSGRVELAAGTWLHPLSQEMLRAMLYVRLADGRGRNVRDAGLTRGHPDSVAAAERIDWRIQMLDALPAIIVSQHDVEARSPLEHPIVEVPERWLSQARFRADGLAGSLPPLPDEDTRDWESLADRVGGSEPFAAVRRINAWTRLGRTNGWSKPLARAIAVAYADLAKDSAFPSSGGWYQPVFAARAIAYADWARGDAAQDETLAYVLARLGRPADAKAVLPENPTTDEGQLARALALRDIDALQAIVGTPDQYGLKSAGASRSLPSHMSGWSPARQTRWLRIAAEIMKAEDRENAARAYLDAAQLIDGSNWAVLSTIFASGGVSAGHRAIDHALRLLTTPDSWKQALDDKATTSAPTSSKRNLPDAANVAQIAEIAKNALQQSDLNTENDAIPRITRATLLRDALDFTWFCAARHYAQYYAVKEGTMELRERMSAWEAVRPEFAPFPRFMTTWIVGEHAFDAIRQRFEDANFEPHSMDLLRMTKTAFGTWLMDRAQFFYPTVQFVASDVAQDWIDMGWIYDYCGAANRRARLRALAPDWNEGYPEPGQLPDPDQLDREFPPGLRSSPALLRRLANEWYGRFGWESRTRGIEFLRRAVALSPENSDQMNLLIRYLMQKGEYEEAIKWVTEFPTSFEGLLEVNADRLSGWAHLHLGNLGRARAAFERAAASWQGTALEDAYYFHFLTGNYEAAKQFKKRSIERYGGDPSFPIFFGDNPENRSYYESLVSFINGLSDEEIWAGKNITPSWNAKMDTPFHLLLLDRTSDALRFCHPLAERVQESRIWFLLMYIARLENDESRFNLARGVLADHVGDAFGEAARYLRGQRQWNEVWDAAVREGRHQPIAMLAAKIAEERGDQALADRWLRMALTPEYGRWHWTDLAWMRFARRGENPLAIVRARFGIDPSIPAP